MQEISSIKNSLTKSSFYGVVQFIIGTLLVIIAIPLFIKNLGTEAYGIFSLVALVSNLNTFSNLGLNSALIRFLAEQGKTIESDHDVIVTIAIQLIVLLPLMLLAVLFRKIILVSILNVPQRLYDDAEWLFIFAVISNIVLSIGQIFTAIIDSLQKIYITNLYQIVYNILYWGLILIISLAGLSLKYIACAVLLTTLIWFYLVSKKSLTLWGKLSFVNLRLNARRIIKKQLSYGVQIYVSGLILFFFEPITKILVSNYFGIVEVGYYDLGLRAKGLIYGFMTKLLYPLYPLISKISDLKKIRIIVHDVEQKIFFIILPLVVILLMTIRPLVGIFFETGLKQISITIAFIVSAYLVGSITVTPVFQFLTVKGHVSKTIVVQSINVVINAIVFIVFYKWMGFYVAALANSIAILASFGYLLYLQNKYLNSLIFDNLRQLAIVLGTFIATMMISYITSIYLGMSYINFFMIPLIVISFTAYIYKRTKLIRSEDVYRYLGENNAFSKLLVRIISHQYSY